ncbi:MAG: outer membrane lipoprotein carrier protein LolA [Acidobacteriota bacterium]
MAQRPGLRLWGPVGRWVFLNWPRGSWQYDLVCLAVIVGLFVLPGPQVSEQGRLDVDGVLAAIEAADSALNSFTASMVSSARYVLFDDVEVERGTLSFLKPNYVRRQVEDPALRTEVLADGMAQVYIPRINQADVYPLNSSEQAEDLVVPGLASASELRDAYQVTLENVIEAGAAVDSASVAPPAGGRLYVLHLVPKVGTGAAKHWKGITLWVAGGQWHPARRIVLEQYNGDTQTIDLLDVVRNPKLKPADFKLNLPAGVEVVRHSPPSSRPRNMASSWPAVGATTTVR